MNSDAEHNLPDGRDRPARKPATGLGVEDQRAIVVGLRAADPTDEDVRDLVRLLAERFPALTPRDIVWFAAYTIQKRCYEPTLPPAARGALRQQAEVVRDKSILKVVAAAPDAVRRAGLFPRIVVPPLVLVPPSCEPTLRPGTLEHVMRVLLADYADWMTGLYRIVTAAFSSAPSTGTRDVALYEMSLVLVSANAPMDEDAWRAGAREALASVRGKPGAEHLNEQDVLDQIAHLVDRGHEPFWRGADGKLLPNWRKARDMLGIRRERRKPGAKRKGVPISLDRPVRQSLPDGKTLRDVIAAVRTAGSARSVLDALATAEGARDAKGTVLRTVVRERLAKVPPGSARWHVLRNAELLASGALTLTRLARKSGFSKGTLGEAWEKERKALSRDPRLRALVA